MRQEKTAGNKPIDGPAVEMDEGGAEFAAELRARCEKLGV